MTQNGAVAWRSRNISLQDRTFSITQYVILPIADFSATPLLGSAPLQVTFTDSSNNATGWLWDFGDGGTSTLQNPTLTYQATRNPFTVTLTATNINGSVAVTKAFTATFCSNGPVWRSGFPYYTSVKEAYTAIGPGGEEMIYIQAVELSGPAGAPIFDVDTDVILKGGYDCAYSATRIPDSLIEGPLTIIEGTVTFAQIAIE